MHVNLDTSASRWISPFQTKTQETAAKSKTTDASANEKTDEVILSSQKQEAAAQSTDPFSKMKTAVQEGDLVALAKAAKEKNDALEINWNKEVDPDGLIYSTTYIRALVSQYQEVESTIKAYYAEAHQENLSFANPYAHILHKYRMPDSSDFNSAMTPAEREMAFRQERALLRGDHVALNDPYALASSGGALRVQDADKIARQTAQDKIDELIQARKEALESESDT